jgi:hypothetical protein
MQDPDRGGMITISQADAKGAIQSIFASTKCYDLMQVSSKALVFEASIPFQLAFYALVEHGAFFSHPHSMLRPILRV